MLHSIKKVYFYGELGCLNYAILGHLEKKQPKHKLIISTYPDYFKIIKIKYEKAFLGENLKIKINRQKFKNSGFGWSDEIQEQLGKLGYVSLSSYLKLKNKCRDNILAIKTPLTIENNPFKEEFIGISCRKRNHEPERNLSKENWIEIINLIREKTNLTIISHGMELDTYDMSEMGIKRASSIEESICYLNKSRIFIASMSGIAQMASNCGCSVVQIGNIQKHINYDPFNKGAICTSFKEISVAIDKFI